MRQAGSYVGPDKLRFDFTHGAPLSDEDRAWVEDRVNEQILANDPVRALTTTLDEAKQLGAMALFGEKYGDVVRMVEIGDGSWSRELCGGTHVRSTAEIGVFKITTETSSAANVRRIEAVTGPVAVDDAAPPRPAAARRGGRAAHRARERRGGRGRRARRSAAQLLKGAAGGRAGRRQGLRGGRARRRARRVRAARPRRPEGAARPRGPDEEPARRPRRRRARRGRRGQGEPARGGDARRGRARREGGRRSSRSRRRSSAAAAAAATRWPRRAASSRRSCPRRCTPRAPRSSAVRSARALMRVLALDYGSARCGAAVSDPTGTLATPLEPVLRPGTRKGFARVVALAGELGAERVVVGLPLSLSRRRLRPDRRDARVRRAPAARRAGPGRAV